MPEPGALPRWERFNSTTAIGRRLIAYGEVESTMDTAWSLAEAGAAHGTAVLAGVQSKGRGRFGRRWTARPGDALLLSVVLRPPSPTAPLLNVAANLAVREAVWRASGLECTFKWPNDVLARGRKVCGTLVEARITAGVAGAAAAGASTAGDEERETHKVVAVLGLGLNLDLDSEAYPELRETATSLRQETRVKPSMKETVRTLLLCLNDTYDEALAGVDLVGRWREALETLGKQIVVQQRDGPVEGLAEDVDQAGRLLLRTNDGRLHTLTEGEVSLSTREPLA